MAAPLLKVENLKTSFFTYAGEVRAVDGVSFEVYPGETIAVVGESGCGKSVTALSIMGLVPEPGRVLAGTILFDGRDLVPLKEEEWQQVRGNDLAMIFQDPMTSLNPVLTIGLQLSEGLRRHQGLSAARARQRAVEMLHLVGIPNPEHRIGQYPHEFSGGMRQRVMIAMALSCDPRLLIADEPTTALDVTIQAQIIELMKKIQEQLDTAIILITHDLGVVARVAARVVVMYAGKIVESGPINRIYHEPGHPYTSSLLSSLPRLDQKDKQRLVPIQGQPPDLLSPPGGCAFNPRCQQAMNICLAAEPPAFAVGEGHRAACWLLDDRAPRGPQEPREPREPRAPSRFPPAAKGGRWG